MVDYAEWWCFAILSVSRIERWSYLLWVLSLKLRNLLIFIVLQELPKLLINNFIIILYFLLLIDLLIIDFIALVFPTLVSNLDAFLILYKPLYKAIFLLLNFIALHFHPLNCHSNLKSVWSLVSGNIKKLLINHFQRFYVDTNLDVSCWDFQNRHYVLFMLTIRLIKFDLENTIDI